MSDLPIKEEPNSNNQPVPQQLNNGVLSSTHSMPMKIFTSDNDSTFGLNRMLFQRSYLNPVNYSQPQQGNEIIQRQSPGIRNGFILDGAKTVNQKKWIGGNRDASDIISRRRINSTGSILNTSGNQSFKNPNDNNPRIDALARVRGGGARVPPKVQNRPVNVSYAPVYYRIISAGFNSMITDQDDGQGNTFTGYILTPNLSATGISPGIYSYPVSDPDSTANPLANIYPLENFLRSYNVLTIDRKTGNTIFKNYDVYNNNSTKQEPTHAGEEMINYLNSLSSSVIVIIATFDEPETYGNDTEPLTQSFVDAVKRCGGSSSFGSKIGSYEPGNYNGKIYYRSAYVLVGIPGIGVNNGSEYYSGGEDGDPYAVIDLRISIDYKGNYNIISPA